jgi:hypothetical protein
MIQLLYHHSLLQEFQKLPPHQEQLLDINAPAPLLLTGPAASVVLNVITGLPEEEPCNPFTVAIEIAEIPTPAPANCVNVIAVPAAPPTVIESFVVKTHAVSARVVPSSMNIKALAVTSVSASKSVALSHTPLAPVPAVVTTYTVSSAVS